MKTVSVIGLGYIGLPTTALLANNGFSVQGVDIDPEVIRTINSGDVHIDEVGLRTLVAGAVRSGKLKASTTPCPSDVFILAVPTPILLDTRPDLSHIFSSADAILPVLKPGDLVIIESTVPPGTSADVAEYLGSERRDLRGVDGNLMILVAHCPERVLPGQILKELVENDRVIGGLTPEATQAAADLYGGIVSGSIFKTDATTAEMVKLAENTYRDVNIALANEMALICEKLGISVWDVIGFASKHPRVKYLRPGPGVGGHCIAVDPWFVVAQFPEEAAVIRAARERNDGMPGHVVGVVLEMLRGIAQPKIACLGVSYKGNVGDIRESPSIKVLTALRQQLPGGSVVSVNDPHVQTTSIHLEPLGRVLEGADLIILLTDHKEYGILNPAEIANVVRTKQVFDTRRLLRVEEWIAAGFRVRVLGHGTKL
jgi:UDP-N-acetyl-D-mannosaminuronic acid dehydrogenase